MIRDHLRMSALSFVFALACGCGDDHEHPHEAGDAGHGHPHDEGQEGDAHGHGHEGASEVVTRWGDTTQLFVEFPALVVGEDSPFAAHLTRLSDHMAIDSGTVVVELRGGTNPVERFTVEQPTVAGIFRPIVKPAHAGPRQVTLRLESSAASEVHELGDFTVYTTRSAADAAAGEEEEDGAISYLLEQQWKVPFRVAQVEARELRPNIPAFARLSSPPEAESIVTAPRDGRVNAIGGRFPRVGDEVEEGHVIFGLGTAPDDQGDPASLDHAVREASIGVAAAQREVDRLEPLVEQGVVAQRRLDEANSALSIAESHLSSARRRKRSLGQSQLVGGRGDGLDVPSPIPGTVAEVLVAPGAWVTEGQPLARIVDRDQLWLDVSVPEAYVGGLGKVSGAWFQLEGVEGALDVPGSALVSVGTEIDAQTRTLPVRFQIDNARRELFAGMTTQAHLVVDTPQLITAIPVEALVEDGGTDVVYVQTGGESFERRMVELGIRDGDHIAVLDGVAPGEWVVARGAHSVKLASSSTAAIGHGHAH
jgi:cobalt-zinc-cadmium efflux system membrane fusion protein